MSKKYLTKI